MECTTLAVLAALQGVQCANILGITTLLSHSHHIWNEILAVGLSDKGHNITLLSHDPKQKGNENYTVILLEGVYDAVEKISQFETSVDEPFTADTIWECREFTCMLDLESEGLQTILNYPEDYKFDLILWDMSSGECLFPLIKRFGNPPIVGTSPFGVQPYISEMMGNHIFNYIPFAFSVPSDRVNFWQRLYNTYQLNYLNYRMHNDYLKRLTAASKKFFGNDIEDFLEVERRIAVALVNTDANYDFPQALPPNVIAVGGLQIAPPKPLPNDLKKLLDEAKNGVIYFSLGSNLKSEKVPGNFFNTFSECFAKLPYTILWKIDSKDRKFPKNVFTRKWLPQSDILAHPNVKVFISHGGSLGTQEAMHRGVPVVGLPFFLDQMVNIEKMVARGLGQKLDLKLLTSENICKTLEEVLNNKTYSEKMKQLSSRVRDQETTPLQRAIFWVEYVLRHGTGEHLSLAARDMSVIETLNLDIMLFVLVVCIVPFLFLGLCYRSCKSSSQSKIKQKLY